jgi:iron complex transport system permease protein
VDTVARMLYTVEIPLSIITAVIGAPFFFFLLARSKKGFIS